MVEFRGNPRETQQQALNRLYEEHHVALRKFLRARLGISQELDDIVQEVFARLAKIENLAELLPIGEEGSLSYLFRAANNLAINIERHKTVRNRYLDGEKLRMQSEEVHFDHTPERINLVREELSQIRNVIAGMNINTRQAFILNRFKQRTYKEIAKDMGVSVKQVEKYIQKALVIIRRAVSETQKVER
ncbi:sigma-70 family RNA polymerase sigma factor [Porticoccaceae bacterium LTM1]|nr:sigma-70 family RNA polymerase sigma factor [Porticoccaceae bacterium LTM1]